MITTVASSNLKAASGADSNSAGKRSIWAILLVTAFASLALPHAVLAASNAATSYNYIYYITGDNDAPDNDLLVKKTHKKTAAKNQNDLVREQNKNRLVQVPSHNLPPTRVPIDQNFAQAISNKPVLVQPAQVGVGR